MTIAVEVAAGANAVAIAVAVGPTVRVTVVATGVSFSALDESQPAQSIASKMQLSNMRHIMISIFTGDTVQRVSDIAGVTARTMVDLRIRLTL